jgi:hypothetical protein
MTDSSQATLVATRRRIAELQALIADLEKAD